MPTYQEGFRLTSSARQLVLSLLDHAGRPYGFVAVCRAEGDDPFAKREEGLVLNLRDCAERALRAFESSIDWSTPALEICCG